ncbi:MAG: hypothetical protein WKF84_27115 [Pyrinomonadaceae bacterium]
MMPSSRGAIRGRVITVHSNQRGEEADETVQRLLAVENPNEPIEVVVHVNKLGEGWDVTNLYTIVPLRAANSPNLVEQSIGRGLRLPFGRRTGVKAVDRLTIVSHDHFQTIIDKANDSNSIIRTGVIIGRDIANGASRTVQINPNVMLDIEGNGMSSAVYNAPVAPASSAANITREHHSRRANAFSLHDTRRATDRSRNARSRQKLRDLAACRGFARPGNSIPTRQPSHHRTRRCCARASATSRRRR